MTIEVGTPGALSLSNFTVTPGESVIFSESLVITLGKPFTL